MLSNRKTMRTHICLVLVAFLLLSMVPFGALAATQEVSVTGISAYNFRGNDWYIILDVDQADFALTGVSGLKAPMDSTTSQIGSKATVRWAWMPVRFPLHWQRTKRSTP